VDLDGTLIKGDLLFESLLSALKSAPWILFLLPVWLLRGRSHMKLQIARRADLNVSHLPYNVHVVDLLVSARRDGRQTVLVTGSQQKYARQINQHLGLFDEVLASDGVVNLTGPRKAEALNGKFGADAYSYVANDRADLPVWQSAAEIVSVGASRGLVKRIERMDKPHVALDQPSARLRHWLRALRLHQWAKNGLLFVPLITAHRMFEIDALMAVTLAFLAFGCAASSGYIVNDLLDLESDRQHKSKRNRPFASGELSAKAGLVVGTSLLATGAGIALTLPAAFGMTLAIYFASTILYSLWLKRVASLDVMILAGLYTVRVIAGAFAVGLALSFWLLAFALFVFLCLAIVKRVAELIDLREQAYGVGAEDPSRIRVAGREYNTSDIPVLQSLGTSSGYLAVLVLALYINSSEVALLYTIPELLWVIVPLMLLWVTRIWIITTRGYMHDDPIVFAIKDPETWLTAFVTAGILVVATVGIGIN
jgi:4-hydroxybenzoate polyprenyltransferase